MLPLNAHALTHNPDLHLHAHQAAQAEDAPEASALPSAPGPVKAVLASTRANWPLVLFHLLILLGAIGYAATATAQPMEAVGVSPEAIQAVAGDPWATVVVALLFVGGQLVAAWRDWSKVRGTDLEKARADNELLTKENLALTKVIAKLEYERDLARSREGDARAALSGTPSRPPELTTPG